MTITIKFEIKLKTTKKNFKFRKKIKQFVLEKAIEYDYFIKTDRNDRRDLRHRIQDDVDKEDFGNTEKIGLEVLRK